MYPTHADIGGQRGISLGSAPCVFGILFHRGCPFALHTDHAQSQFPARNDPTHGEGEGLLSVAPRWLVATPRPRGLVSCELLVYVTTIPELFGCFINTGQDPSLDLTKASLSPGAAVCMGGPEALRARAINSCPAGAQNCSRVNSLEAFSAISSPEPRFLQGCFEIHSQLRGFGTLPFCCFTMADPPNMGSDLLCPPALGSPSFPGHSPVQTNSGLL